MKDPIAIPLPQATGVKHSSIEPQLQWLPGAAGAKLSCRIWRGKLGQPVVLYLHGIEGHSQWFHNTASILNQRGITVYAPDRRGSGLNFDERGHLSSYKLFLADVEMALKHIYNQYEGHAIVLMGNCWGAKSACIMAGNDYTPVDGKINGKLSGLVLTCPAIYTKVDFDLKTKGKIACSWLCKGRQAFNNWLIPIKPFMFTDNEIYLNYIKADPLRLTQATTSFFVETMWLTKMAQKAAKRIDLPLLILQSGNDQIVDVRAIESWYAKIKAMPKLMRIFPGAAHSIDFDGTYFREYTNILSDWLISLK